MYPAACGALLLAGIALNLQDRRMLALTALVGVSIFLPVPAHTQFTFYGFCIAAEITVALLALSLNTRAGGWVAELCALMVIAHVMGYVLDGSPPFSPYRYIVKILEISQLAACIVLSPVLAPILRNHHDATITR